MNKTLNGSKEDAITLTAKRREFLQAMLREQGVEIAPATSISRRLDPESRPVSSAQRRLWLFQELAGSSPVLNIGFALHLEGSLQEASLVAAVDQVVRRHEILRTRIHLDSTGEFVQVLEPEWQSRITGKLSAVETCSATGKDWRVLVAKLLSEPFDLAAECPFRPRLIRLTNTHHVLVLVVHHIAFDESSIGVLIRDLAEAYNAFHEGASGWSLPALEIQYGDFAAWEAEQLGADQYRRELEYWRGLLSEPLTTTALPADRRRPRVNSYHGGRVPISVSPRVSAELGVLARTAGATLYAILMSAFLALLKRYRLSSPLVVGTAQSSRFGPETYRLIGCFLNNLIVKVDVDEKHSFLELLSQVNAVIGEALANSMVPFEDIVEAVNPPRYSTYTPIFEIMFTLQAETDEDPIFRGLDYRLEHLDSGCSQFALTLNLWQTSEGLGGWLEYNSELFDQETIGAFGDAYRTLLKGALSNPDKPISALTLLAPDQGESRAKSFGATTLERAPKRSALELIWQQAERTPDAEAVRGSDGEFSYRELCSRVCALADHLAERGIGAGQLVGICLDRTTDSVTAVLAIWRVGAAYLPLDPDFPQQRLEFMVEDSGVQWLVTEASIGARFAGCGAQSIMVDELWSELGTQCGTSPEALVGGESLAYVIYTSGSTGRPKGVQVTHHNVVSFLSAMAREPGLAAGDTLLAVTTLSFDIALLELLLPLVVGARVVIATREEALDGRRLLAQLERCEANAMQATPATWRLLIEAGWQGEGQFKVLCGGEALSRDLADALLARAGQVWNMYGPTETTVWSTCGRVEAGTGVVPIGRPIANTRVYVLDGHRQPVPVGVPGELYIGGAGVTRGYLNRPELTAERFVTVDLGVGPDERLYRTGDLVRYRGDGTLEYLSRMDHQVKVRGFRIELGEIEAVLGEHAGIRRVVVQVREQRTGDQRLVAYMVPAEASQFTVTELRKYLRGKLPDYMVPQHFVELDALPLTPNGKVDRKALPDPLATHDGPDRGESEPPTTPFECELASIWKEALGVERIGVDDNFFELGGHSLLALRVISRIREATGSEVALMSLALQSLGEIARHCEQAVEEGPEPASYSGSETVGLLGKVRGAWRSVSGRRASP